MAATGGLAHLGLDQFGLGAVSRHPHAATAAGVFHERGRSPANPPAVNDRLHRALLAVADHRQLRGRFGRELGTATRDGLRVVGLGLFLPDFAHARVHVRQQLFGSIRTHGHGQRRQVHHVQQKILGVCVLVARHLGRVGRLGVHTGRGLPGSLQRRTDMGHRQDKKGQVHFFAASLFGACSKCR